MNYDNVCIIRAKFKKDYVYDAIKHYGYNIITPYKGNNIILRIFREIWFRGNLPGKRLWFRCVESKNSYKVIILYDPLIMPEYIEWIHHKNPGCRIILTYENRADKTIRPDTVPSYVEKWSYDMDDCRYYHMKWSAPSFFMEYRRERKEKPQIDVLYVGRDKGRAEILFDLQKSFKDLGLKTYFHICADRKHLRFKKKFYKRVLDYDEYLNLLIDTKAILNIIPNGQTSVTQRELEAAFDGVKCITNNRGIKEFDLYDRSIFFILGEDDLESLPGFLNSDTKKYNEGILEKYEANQRIQQMICE